MLLRQLSVYDRAALVIAAGFILIAAAYSRATPLFEPPDEAAHFLYAHNILEQGGLPLLEDRSSVFASQSTQRHHMPLYYLIGAVLISGTNRADAPLFLLENPLASIGVVGINNQNLVLHPWNPPTDGTVRAVFILRAFSIVLGTGTILLIYRGASLAFSPRTGVIAALLAASIPTYIFISGSISNDNLVTFLFTAGVVWCITAWQRADLTWRAAALLGLILGGIALSKHNGLALFGVVGVVVLAGVFASRWSLAAAIRALTIAGALAALLAGWWYVRNLQLYGDLFAISASTAIWGRGDSISVTPRAVLDEARGIYYSFWMTLGYLNVTGPAWLFPCTLVIVVGALGGVIVRGVRAVRRGETTVLFALALCGLVIAAVVAAQIVTTRQIASSQGRILFPALIAFTPLVVVGWTVWIGRRWVPVLVAPIAAAALTGPTVYLPDAYRPLTAVPALPTTARAIDANAEGLRLIGYELDAPLAAPGDVLTGALYFTGSHADNPRVILRALDPRTGEVLGGAEFYPGMAPTASLDPALTYRMPFRFRLDVGDPVQSPVRLRLLVEWRTVEADDPAQGRYLTWDTASAPTLFAWTLLDPDYTAGTPGVPVAVTFGGAIRLEGYTLGNDDTLTLYWRRIAGLERDYTLALGVLDAGGNLIAQADGELAGYPTSAWMGEGVIADVRRLTLPESAASIYLGWYDAATGIRLPADPDPHGDALWTIPLSAGG